jgi:hypothetical protein
MRRAATRLHARTLPMALAAITASLALATPAHADVGETIILRCTHQESLAGFKPSDYAKALKELAAAGGSTTAEASAPIAATPAEQRAIDTAQGKAPGSLAVGARRVAPGIVHADVASAFSSLPTPLLAVLAVLLACLGLIGARPLRDRFRGGRPD